MALNLSAAEAWTRFGPPFAEEFTGPRGHSLLPGGYGRTTLAIAPRIPMAIAGAGYLLRDDQGRESIDLHNNFTVMLHGHGHPALVEAAHRAMLDGSCFGLPNVFEIDHARLLLERLPYLDQVRYTASGTEAVMLAVRLARAYTGRNRVVMAHLAYHGLSDVALVTGGSALQRGIPAGVINDTLETEVNDVNALRRVFEANRGEIAAIFVDPMPNRAGMIKVMPEFWRTARELCDEHGVVLVSDEVIGLRLAYEGAAHSAGVVPDVVAMGKIIGGGLPVGAIAGKFEIMDTLNPLAGGIEHAGTFSANPVSLAAGLVSMQLFGRAEVDRLNLLGSQLREGVASRVHGSGWEVRGDGSLFRLLPTNPDPGRSKAAQSALWWAAYECGVLLGQNGTGSLSTPMDSSVVNDVVAALEQAVKTVAAKR